MGTWIIILLYLLILFSLHPELLGPLLVTNLVGLCLFFIGATLYYGTRALGATSIVNFFDAHPEYQRRLNNAVDLGGTSPTAS
jgi:Na+/citrate or Na+/malate symporter